MFVRCEKGNGEACKRVDDEPPPKKKNKKYTKLLI